MHGQKVIDTARAQGYQGSVYPLDSYAAPYRQAVKMDKAAAAVWDRKESREQLRSAVYAEVLADRVAILNSVSKDLEFFHQQGVVGAVVNLSMGTSLASSVVGVLESRFGEDVEGKEEGYQGKRLCQAFDCDRDKIKSNDSEVSRRETHKLLQNLFELAQDTSEDLEFLASKHRYDSSVRDFVGNRNSLVVAASNEGDFAESLTWMSETPVEVPAQFQANDLAHPKALVVGAVSLEGGHTRVADYSSDYRGVNFYALGTVAGGEGKGTSFAAPRVSAVLAQLHYEHPEQSSQGVENLLREKFSSTLLDYQGRQEAPVLNEVAAQEYLFSKKL